MPARRPLLRTVATALVAAVLLALPGAAPALAADPQLVEIDRDTSTDLGTPYGVVLAPDGDHVYAVGSAGNLVTFARSANGRLSQVDADALGDSANYLAASADGKNVYVTTSSAVVTADVRRNGTLAVAGRISAPQVPSMVSPYGVDVSRDGRLVYVTDQSAADGAVHVLRRRPSDGRLTFASSYKPQAGAPGEVGVAYVVADSTDGRQVYVARCDSGGSLPGLLVLKHTGSDRLRLAQQRVLGTPGSSQCGWGIAPGARSVLIVDYTGDAVESFKRASTGGLRPGDTLTDPALDEPYYLVRPGGGATAFVESYAGNALGRLTVDADGDLRMRGVTEVAAPYGSTAADRRHVYVSGYGGNEVIAFRRRD